MACFCLAGGAFCQEIQIPTSTDVMAFSKRPSSSMYAVCDIFPMGWSEDGDFAYVHRRRVAGRGGVVFTYTIVNAVSDVIAWKHEDDWPRADTVSVSQSIARNRDTIACI